MEIYIAASIKRNNNSVIRWSQDLRRHGHTPISYYDLGPPSARHGQDFPDKDTLIRPDFADDPDVREASLKDKNAILKAGVLLYLEPAGISANRELGFAHHAGKLIIAYNDMWHKGEYDVMDDMINVFCNMREQVFAVLEAAEVEVNYRALVQNIFPSRRAEQLLSMLKLAV